MSVHPVVYSLFNHETEKYYIGITTKAVTSRWLQHLYQSEGKNTKLGEALKNSNRRDWSFRILFEYERIAKENTPETIEKFMRFLEAHYILKYNSVKNGYNLQFAKDCFPKNYDFDVHEFIHKRYNTLSLFIKQHGEEMGLNKYTETYGKIQWSKDIQENFGFYWNDNEISEACKCMENMPTKIRKHFMDEVI